jgi:ribose-phosphate pyrophosphokinase
MQVFSGSSNQELAKKIAKLMDTQLGKVAVSKFENGEKRVAVGKGSGSALIVQSLSQPVDENLVELCLIADALTRQGFTNLSAVVPWLGYSKQDKVFLPGEPLSAKVVAQIIQTTKIKKLMTFDLHNRAITGFFDVPVVELSAKPIFLDYFRKTITKNSVVVAPDEGAVKSSAYFAKELNIPIAYMDKRRDLRTGKVEVMGMTGEVKGKEVLIVDDMIVTGSTLMESAKYLKKMGAKSVKVAATHHLYVAGAQERLEMSEIDEVVVTDTVQYMTKKVGGKSKLKILSVAQMIVDELR